uniref:Acetylserotonin O-methyltransferase n=1 Tax=Astyanax mexicanus TaxID=7994 RepID=A0A8B9KDD8_ASTMX
MCLLLYSNTEMSSVFLTKSSPRSLYHSIDYNSNTMYLCWHYLPHAIPVSPAQKINNKKILTGLKLSCSGALARQCVKLYPDCTVTIFDLPKVVQMSREHFLSPEEDRISFHEGDFFKDSLPEADLYVLARILHDWTDERNVELLSKIHQSCRPGGGVLVVEALLSEDNSGPLTAQLYSLNMLVQTEGRERKGSEYAALLTRAGFTTVHIHNTGKIYDAVLGLK